jgi:hypothetical protein
MSVSRISSDIVTGFGAGKILSVDNADWIKNIDSNRYINLIVLLPDMKQSMFYENNHH